MSDYLWDKTGEPEEDIEQLENLLGTLRYQPRPLEIPATAMPTAARSKTTLFSRPRIALAASLLLALLAGMWFVTRQDESKTQRLAQVEQKSATGESKQAATAVVPQAARRNSSEPVDGGGVVEPETRENSSGVVAAATPKLRQAHRAPRRFVARRQKLQPPKREVNTPAPREEVAANGTSGWQVEQPLTPQQREATEQLMLALRLASAKFNYAQREMQEIGRAGK